ncbi:MAG: hypothetical protein Udaeo2_12730 [Candidatus Udaeobacter sp.]|nr:MAG: hypothetical protein Udaeo2_12730 [Candidatus Udaeobacter sp.]
MPGPKERSNFDPANWASDDRLCPRIAVPLTRVETSDSRRAYRLGRLGLADAAVPCDRGKSTHDKLLAGEAGHPPEIASKIRGLRISVRRDASVQPSDAAPDLMPYRSHKIAVQVLGPPDRGQEAQKQIRG